MLARFMIIQQKRKLDVPNAIGEFKMAVFPRSLFNNASTLFTSGNDSSIMNTIQTLPTVIDPVTGRDAVINSPATPDPVAVIHETTTDELPWIENLVLPDHAEKVLIIHAMAVVQGMKKKHQMKKMSNLREVFTLKDTAIRQRVYLHQ